MRLVGVLLLGLAAAGAAAPPEPSAASRAWRVRAAQAGEFLEDIQKRLDDERPGVAKKAKCEALVEMAFLSHSASSELYGVVHKIDGELEAFHLMLNGGDAGILDLAWIPKGQAWMFRVDSIPKRWTLLIPEGRVLVISTGQCSWALDIDSPFEVATFAG